MKTATTLCALLVLGIATLAYGQAGSLPPPETPEEEAFRELSLDDATIARLHETGLVVLPEDSSTDQYRLYYGLYSSAMPAYITCDALLHVWRGVQAQAVQAAERQWLRPRLLELATGLLAATERLRGEADEETLRSNAVALETVCCLLTPEREPSVELAADVNAELERVRGASAGDAALSDEPELHGYHQAEGYLARWSLGPSKAPPEEGLRRALLLCLAMRSEPVLVERYRELAQARAYLHGPPEVLGLDGLLAAADRVWGAGWGRASLADLSAVRAELAGRTVACLGEAIGPEAGLLAMTTPPTLPGRPLPLGLDVAAALGSQLAERSLPPEVGAGARAYAVSRKPDGLRASWESTVAAMLQRPEGLPAAYRSEVYERKQLNCCLAAWAGLVARAPEVVARGPKRYRPWRPELVEPVPAFYRAYADMCAELATRLEAWGVSGEALTDLRLLEREVRGLAPCAEDQLAGRKVSEETDAGGFLEWLAEMPVGVPPAVAAVATDPETGETLHVGTRGFHRLLVRCEHEGRTVVAQGWVESYCEVVTPRGESLSGEAWQALLASNYNRPPTPAWLADLYQPTPAADAEALARLHRIERRFMDGEAEAAAEALIEAEAQTEWAPAALLLLGRYLAKAGRDAEAVAVLRRVDAMYGCDARDAAIALRYECEERVSVAAAAKERAEILERDLQGTEPRAGLSEAEEVDRQNRRAVDLLASLGDTVFAGPALRPTLERITAECPLSGYLPYAELVLATPMAQVSSGPTSESPTRDELQEAVPRLLGLADRYPDSAVALVSRLQVAGARMELGDIDGGSEEVLRLCPLRSRTPDPYPLSAAALREHEIGPAFLPTNPDGMGMYLSGVPLSRACLTGDAELTARLVELTHLCCPVREHLGEIPQYLNYLRDEPDALREVLPLLGPNRALARPELRDGALALTQRAELCRRIVAERPDSRAGPAAAYLLWRETRYRRDAGSTRVRAEMVETLARLYPESLEWLVVQYGEAARENDLAAMARLALQVDGRVEGVADHAPEAAYLSLLSSECRYRAQQLGEFAAGLLELRPRLGEFISQARLAPEELAVCASEVELVRMLVARLPESALRIIVASGHEDWHADEAYAAMARSPEDPLVPRVRMRIGGLENLAAVVALGPDTPEFSDAVEQFCIEGAEATYSLPAELYSYCAVARKHRGTPAEVLGLAGMVATYARYGCPERAVAFAEAELARLGADALLRDRLEAQRDNARQQAADKLGPEPQPLWAVEAGLAGPEGAIPVVADAGGDALYVARAVEEGPAEVMAVDGGTGKVLWSVPTGRVASLVCDGLGDGHRDAEDGDGSRAGETAARGGVVLYGTLHGSVGCLDAEDGEQLWAVYLGLAQTGRVELAQTDAGLIALWDQGELLGLEPETGEVLWRRDFPLSALYGLYPGEPCVAVGSDVLVAWDARMRLSAWVPDGSRRLWALSMEHLVPETVEQGGSRPWTTILCDGTVVCGGGRSQTPLVGIDVVTGAVTWRKRVGQYPELVGGSFGSSGPVLVHQESALSELAPRDGALRWTVTLPEDYCGGGPLGVGTVSTDEYVAVGLPDTLLVIDRERGRIAAGLPELAGALPVHCTAKDGGLRLHVWRQGKLQAFEVGLGDGGG